jgi:hypothetical protein
MSSSSVTDITKVVAPIAFNALIAAAEKLAGAANAAFALKNMLLKVVADISGRTAMNDPVDSSALFNSLSAAGNNLWQNNFGYFYNGQTSRCILPDGIHTAKALNSGTDLLIHDESQGQVPNVQGYLTSLFKNTP